MCVTAASVIKFNNNNNNLSASVDMKFLLTRSLETSASLTASTMLYNVACLELPHSVLLLQLCSHFKMP